jgi:ribose transport system substrate-binding protein
MIKTAKAYTSQAAVASELKDFKVISTGTDVPAQISAVNNFIDSGYDAVVIDAESPDAYAAVVQRAKDAGVILVSFDNIINSPDVVNVNVDQKGIGTLQSQWIIEKLPKGGKVLEVRGPAGQFVDKARHDGLTEGLAASGKTYDVTTVIGGWTDSVAQKAVADTLAVKGDFDAVVAQGGDNGVVQAMIDGKQPWVPFAGETENGFRKACAKYEADGLLCQSAGTGPAQVAVAIKTAIDLLHGKAIPQLVKLPTSVAEAGGGFKDGDTFYSDQNDSFFVGNDFPDCKINVKAVEIMGNNEANTTK